MIDRALALRIPLLAALGAVAVGCQADPRDLPWGCVPENAAAASRAAYVEATILDGGCGGDVLFRTRVGDPTRPPRLARGRYGLACRARDPACVWFAYGCVDVDLPVANGTEVRVPFNAASEEPACPTSQCMDGVCAGDDAGPADAGFDGPPDGAPPDGPPPDAAPCGPGCTDTCCDVICVDTMSDERHCGRCDMPCGATETCCGGFCVDTMADDNHCGDCDNDCDDGRDCCDGECVDTDFDEMNCSDCGRTCSGSTDTCCNGSCVNTDTSMTHCGRCFRSCGTTCTGGACGGITCTGSLVLAGGRCTDPDTDPLFCGTPAVTCDADERCVGGSCTCRPGLTRVGSSCVDVDSDPANCGSPTAPCTGGDVCRDGVCEDECEGGGTDCTAAGYAGCVAVSRDPLHCGSCTNACSAEEVCVAGACLVYEPGVDTTAGSACTGCPCMSCGMRVCCSFGGEVICVEGSTCPM